MNALKSSLDGYLNALVDLLKSLPLNGALQVDVNHTSILKVGVQPLYPNIAVAENADELSALKDEPELTKILELGSEVRLWERQDGTWVARSYQAGADWPVSPNGLCYSALQRRMYYVDANRALQRIETTPL